MNLQFLTVIQTWI